MSSARPVLGADVCSGRWVGVLLDPGGAFTAAFLEPTITALVSAAGGPAAVEVVGVDMPIGLAENGPRECDRLTRARLGRLGSSVFSPPVRAAAERALPYPEALAANRAATGGIGLSRQAWGLGEKIREVAAWLATGTAPRAVEAHPELCFATLRGAPLPASKRTWTGHVLRRSLLAEHGIVLPDDLGAAGAAAPDDVLDAAAAAWTARRVARGEAERLPPATPSTPGDHPAVWV